jgi:hypothetical protein
MVFKIILSQNICHYKNVVERFLKNNNDNEIEVDTLLGTIDFYNNDTTFFCDLNSIHKQSQFYNEIRIIPSKKYFEKKCTKYIKATLESNDYFYYSSNKNNLNNNIPLYDILGPSTQWGFARSFGIIIYYTDHEINSVDLNNLILLSLAITLLHDYPKQNIYIDDKLYNSAYNKTIDRSIFCGKVAFIGKHEIITDNFDNCTKISQYIHN